LRVNSQEESPSCRKTVFHLTNGRSNTRESATENRLLLCVRHLDRIQMITLVVKVKR